MSKRYQPTYWSGKGKPRKTNCPSDGQPWQKFEDAMFDLPVLFHFVEK